MAPPRRRATCWLAPACYQCRVCRARGHLARDCPQAQVLPPSAAVKHPTLRRGGLPSQVDVVLLDSSTEEEASLAEVEDTTPPSQGEDKAGPQKSLSATTGRYTVVFCHLDTLCSSNSPFLHLTQLAATAAGSNFFRAVLPSVLAGYLDTCRLGGDLLHTLNMTREDGGTFLFRQSVLVRRQTERVECRPARGGGTAGLAHLPGGRRAWRGAGDDGQG